MLDVMGPLVQFVFPLHGLLEHVLPGPPSLGRYIQLFLVGYRLVLTCFKKR